MYVGTIHSNHAELSKQMLEAGKHVLCEKPMAINWKQGKEVIDLARRKNLLFGEVGLYRTTCICTVNPTCKQGLK